MSKSKSSKLDPHAETLVAMELEKKTLAEMIVWLRGEGVTIGVGTLSEYLSELRSQRRQTEVLKLIATGAEQRKQVQAAFAKNPTAELAELIQLHKMLSFQLATSGVDNPELIKLADQLTRTVMEFVSGQTKAAHKERELRLAEDKYQITFCELVLQKAVREAAERIASSNLSNADKIAAMRKEAFKSVDELQASGKVVIPKS